MQGGLPEPPSIAPPGPFLSAPPYSRLPACPQMRAQLALAQVLGRALIFAPLWCGMDRW